jgi:hypothetical protein
LTTKAGDVDLASEKKRCSAAAHSSWTKAGPTWRSSATTFIFEGIASAER